MRGKFEFKDGWTYRMPLHFIVRPFDHNNRVVFSDVLMLKVEQQTDMDVLAAFVPPEFEILRPSVIWSYANCRGVDFLSNGDYRIFQASVPVKYVGGDRELTGVYPLIIWEDDPIPILGGREEDGMPKLYCNISSDRHYENHWFTSAALYSETMARMDFHEKNEAGADEVRAAADDPVTNNFGYRYIPLVEKGGASTKGPILYPQEMHPKQIWHGEGSVQVVVPDAWYKNPSMYQILEGLASLPVRGFTGAARIKGSLRLCIADSKEL